MYKELITKYKFLRSMRSLQNVCEGKYAFVGTGTHSLTNLYPVLDYLKVPLKYICCHNAGKIPLVERRWPGVKATISLSEILEDAEISGVFVSTTPESHFEIALKVLQGKKPLFVEKPPCSSLRKLQELVATSVVNDVAVTMVGMQKRYSPVTEILRKRLKRERPLCYNLRYCVGAYPEGEALLNLFIHPLDYVTYLFGVPEIIGKEKTMRPDGTETILLLLKHSYCSGVLELTTAGDWNTACETMTVRTDMGEYAIENMEQLTFSPLSGRILGIPLEKVTHRCPEVQYLYSRNNAVPTFMNNQIYSQGFFNELKTFVDLVERQGEKGNSADQSPSDLASLLPTYELIESIKKVSKP